MKSQFAKSQSADESLHQACASGSLVEEVGRLSGNLEKSELQIAALNRVLEMMRAAAGERASGLLEPAQALSA
jgi:hypothetical protein